MNRLKTAILIIALEGKKNRNSVQEGIVRNQVCCGSTGVVFEGETGVLCNIQLRHSNKQKNFRTERFSSRAE